MYLCIHINVIAHNYIELPTNTYLKELNSIKGHFLLKILRSLLLLMS